MTNSVTGAVFEAINGQAQDIESSIDQEQLKGYGFPTPNIYFSTDIKPNQVFIKDSSDENNKVFFEVFDNYIFSFEKHDYKGVFSKNYPIFYNPVYFYKKDTCRITPTNILNNNLSEITPQSQTVDLIAAIYKNMSLCNTVDIEDNYTFLLVEEDYTNYCKNNECEDYIKDENFLYYATSIISYYIFFQMEMASVEEILSITKSLIQDDAENKEIDILGKIINYKNNKEIYLNNLLENGKIYVYTLDQDFINDFMDYISDENQGNEEMINSFYNRIEKTIALNSKFIVLCDKNYREELASFIEPSFIFSKVLSFDNLPENICYEVIGTIK